MKHINKLFQGDNLKIMREMPDASVRLIYLDPPFCTGKDFKAFDDRWHDAKGDKGWLSYLKANHEHLYQFIELSEHFYDTTMKVYLTYMTIRLFEMRRILKDGSDGENGGSIFLHCDPTASHYLKLVMDSVFGKNNFRNEIVWAYRTGGVSKRHFPRKHDIILFYVGSNKYQHNPLQERIYYEKPFFNEKTDKQGRFYADVYIRDIWNEIKPLINVSKERTGYPTQKPLALLDRIIKASSNENDVVLDPFCGSGTALESAKRLGRRWIGIDQNPDAIKICEKRLNPPQGTLF